VDVELEHWRMTTAKNQRTTLPGAPVKTPGEAFPKDQGDHMNKDIFEGKWKQMRGQAKVWWGKLTDDDLDKVEGKYDKLIGLLQEKYGYTKQQAEEEYQKRTK
jgi:uncharacterized protein YjbJ (UPF0337 family)